MIIKISNSLVNTIKKLRKNDWKQEVDISDIEIKIKNLLIEDEIINKNDKIKWEIIKEKFQGIYLTSNGRKEVIHFAQMMTVEGKERSRNTYLSQNVVISQKIAKKKNAVLSISINPYDLHKTPPKANFIRNNIKDLSTTPGIKINKSLQYSNFKTDLKDNSFEDFIERRIKTRNANKGNLSTLIQYDKETNKVIIFGRLDGANAPDTLNICKKIQEYKHEYNFKTYFYDVTPNGKPKNKWISQNITELVDYMEDQKNYEKRIIFDLKNKDNKILQRNQPAFKANIIKKYIDVKGFDIHRCFACNYKIETNFIASHIYRYADILKDYKEGKISVKKAAHLIISGDNGFLLCPTQDKEFEKGQIYFDINNKQFVPNINKIKNEEELQEIKNNIRTNNFSNVIFTKEFICNVEKHINRIEKE